MVPQMRDFVRSMALNVNFYQLVALGLILASVIVPLGMPGGGGGGGVG